ncbi:hypothetical protein QBC45DRAFT_327506 [Copromyces sp. CBS 386.78]|nr:hypothetical protein QBC45DRAFT_327506 [Copromyces sp. CBS 386.78]
MPRRQGDEDEDDDYMPDEEYMPRSKRHKSLTQSTSQEEPSTTDSQHSGPQGDFELDEAYTAASYRPNPRRSATVAYDRISQTSRTSRQPHRVEEQQQERLHAQQAGTSRTSHQSQPAEEQPTSRSRVTSEVSRTSRHVHLARPQQQGRRRAPQSQIASNVPVRPSPLSNMSLLRDFQPPQTELTAASGRPVRAAISRTLDRMSRLTQAGSSSAALNPADEDFGSGAPGRPARPPLSREQQRKQDHIMVLYRSIFDSKLKEFPTLMAFEPIPDTWEGPSPRASPAPPAASPNTPQSLNLSISDRAEFDVFHQQSRSSTLRMQTPYGGSALPTPPRGYESYSFQNYPHTQPRLTSASGNEHSNYLSSDVFGQAVPSLRTTPKYHPTNEMTPEELQRYHNDRRLFVKMKAAWVDNEKVLRLRKKEGDQNALQTLWDVAQVFRARNPLNPNAESIKWFVELRDRILRPRSRDQRLSTPADEEGGHDNLGDLVNAGNSVVEEEAEPEPEPMDVDEPEPGEEEMPEANNDDDDDEFVDVDFDELGPAFRMLQQMEQQQRDHARQALQQLEQEQEQQPLETSVSPKGSKGGLGINDLLN